MITNKKIYTCAIGMEKAFDSVLKEEIWKVLNFKAFHISSLVKRVWRKDQKAYGTKE